ncbi:MAG: alkaline phosphatase family protein [Vicinamibacteria bacterium]|nr:alkaline phosphatase family protein [Vicinamibacteria bacterium]
MTRALRRLAPALLGYLAAACGGGSSTLPPTPTPTPPVAAPVRVVIVSIDGLRPDAVQQVNPPNLSALAKKGASTWKAQTITPSNTLPSHISMLSGYPPTRHGVTWDDYLPANGAIRVPMIFSAARGSGRRTALVAGKEKFNTLRDTREMDIFVGGTRADADVAEQAAAQLFSGVDLLVVHLPDVDLSGHASSWMSAAYRDNVARADVALGRVIAALPENTTLIVTADHGGHGTGHGTTDPLDMTIPWIIAGPRIRPDYAIAGAVSTMDTAATAAFLLGLTLPTDNAGKPVLEAFAR